MRSRFKIAFIPVTCMHADELIQNFVVLFIVLAEKKKKKRLNFLTLFFNVLFEIYAQK